MALIGRTRTLTMRRGSFAGGDRSVQPSIQVSTSTKSNAFSGDWHAKRTVAVVLQTVCELFRAAIAQLPANRAAKWPNDKWFGTARAAV